MEVMILLWEKKKLRRVWNLKSHVGITFCFSLHVKSYEMFLADYTENLQFPCVSCPWFVKGKLNPSKLAKAQVKIKLPNEQVIKLLSIVSTVNYSIFYSETSSFSAWIF